MNLQSLTGKYFILRTPDERGSGMTAFSRGKVLGPVHEFFPTYLVEIVAENRPDADEPAINAQMIKTADQLLGAYFYDDQALWQEEWRSITSEMDKVERRYQRRTAARGSNRRR